MDLTGKRAVVVGGATGIGSGICQSLLARGVEVHLCDRDEDGAIQLAASFERGSIKTHRCDVTQPDSLAAAEAAIRVEGNIDLVFANAGVIALKTLVETTPEDWRWLFGVNVFGTVNTLRAFVPGMLSQASRSRIAVTSSIVSITLPPMAGQTVYAASKAAQLGVCEALRAELVGTSVDLSVIFPAAVRSAIRAKSESERPGSMQVAVPPSVAGSGYIEAGAAGERIVRGIEQDRDFIVTHPEEAAQVEARHQRIMRAFAD